MPSMSMSTEASAKSLPARSGVTESTVIETRLDPASFDCTPSIANAAMGRTSQLASLTIIFQSAARQTLARQKHSGGSMSRPRAADDFPAIRARMEELRRGSARGPDDDNLPPAAGPGAAS